jgi:hypothetical protein
MVIVNVINSNIQTAMELYNNGGAVTVSGTGRLRTVPNVRYNEDGLLGPKCICNYKCE